MKRFYKFTYALLFLTFRSANSVDTENTPPRSSQRFRFVEPKTTTKPNTGQVTTQKEKGAASIDKPVEESGEETDKGTGNDPKIDSKKAEKNAANKEAAKGTGNVPNNDSKKAAKNAANKEADKGTGNVPNNDSKKAAKNAANKEAAKGTGNDPKIDSKKAAKNDADTGNDPKSGTKENGEGAGKVVKGKGPTEAAAKVTAKKVAENKKKEVVAHIASVGSSKAPAEKNDIFIITGDNASTRSKPTTLNPNNDTMSLNPNDATSPPLIHLGVPGSGTP